MSTISGIGSKGEKNKSKFKSIDINTLYKGKSVETQKSTVPRQHGLQSLGKVSSLRRMPPPANLPSLKSENSGNDPSISLVPSGGSGWVSKEEKKEGSGGGAQPPSSQLQQATPTQQQQVPPHQAATKTNIPAGGPSSTGVRSWSNVTGGIQQGGLVSHQSPLFQEEFPSLAQEEKNKETTVPTKKEEDIKDTQYGPGPSLRPQNVASWREGGGRAVPQQKIEEPTQSTTNSNQIETQSNGLQMSGGSGAGVGADLPSLQVPPRPSSGHGPPMGPMPMGPPMGIPPPQYRGMMPAYMFGRMPPGTYPPNYPSFRPPYSHDARFRGPPPSMSHQRHLGDGEEGQKRPAIVSDKQLKDFEDLLKSDPTDGGWAGPQGEIDYSEKLVFSDEDDEPQSPRDRALRDERRRLRKENEEHQKESESDKERKDDKEKNDQGSQMVREAWPPHRAPPPHYRGGPRPPHPGMDARNWPPHMLPYEMLGPRGAPPYFRMAPPPQMRPFGPPPVSSPGAMPSRKPGENDDDELWRLRRRANEGEINIAVERARIRRVEDEKKKESEQRAAAAEKLRQLEARAKKKEESKEGDNEGGDSRTTSESSDKEPRESRYRDRPTNLTPPAQSDQGSNTKTYLRNVPPRFQKQQETSQGRQQPPSPVSGVTGGHPAVPPIPQVFRPGQGPPPHWGYDPRAWGAMPPHFLDPRYGPPRPPLDMQGMPMYGPPMSRRRNDSHGSGNENQESETGHGDQFDRPDHRASSWIDGRYPPNPHPGHFDDPRRHYYDQRVYPFDYERRDYERPGREEENHPSEGDTAPKELEQRPTVLQRDSFDERKIMDKEDHKPERSINKAEWDLNRSYSKESNKDDPLDNYDDDDDEFDTKLDKQVEEREEPQEPYSRGYRQSRPTPKFRAYSSEEVKQREAAQKHDAPPPIPSDQNKQSSQAKNNLTSLKRSASNMSSSSAASSDKDRERKSDSPKECLVFERSQGLKRENNKEQSKEIKQSVKETTKAPEQPPPRPNAWEIKEQDRKAKEPDKPEENSYAKDDEDEKPFEERVDSPFSNRPPLKKKREDDQDRRDRHVDDRDRRDRDHDRYNDKTDRPRSTPGRGGREFVRGRGGSRGRGRNSVRGSYNPRGRGKDYYSGSYDRIGGPNRRMDQNRPIKSFHKSDDSEGNEREDYNKPQRRRHGPADDLSDVSADEGSAFNDSISHDRQDKEDERRELKDTSQQTTRAADDNRPQARRGSEDNRIRGSDDIRIHGQRGNEDGKSRGKDDVRQGQRDDRANDETRSQVQRNTEENRQLVQRGPEPNRENKQNRDIRDAKNPWNNENKAPQGVQPPIANVWNNKNSPLLPDPPKTEWPSDLSSKDQKDDKAVKTDVWQRRDSREIGQEKLTGTLQNSVQVDGREKRHDGNNRREDNRRRQDTRDGGRRNDRDRQRGDDPGRNEGPDGEHKDKRDRDKDRYREKREYSDLRQDDINGQFIPRGEPSRRGRGGSRGNRGGGRYTSASGRGGNGQGYNRGANGDQNMNGPSGRYGGRSQNMERSGGGGGSRDIGLEGGGYREGRKDNRNPPPPRFRRGGALTSEGRGRGSDRGSGGRPRSSRGRGPNVAASSVTKKPVLTKQASNEGEEWETASESSEPKNDSRESREKKENSLKKSLSNPRPFSDRPNNRRMNNQDSRNSVERRNSSNKDNKQNQKNGAAPPTKSAANGTTPKSKPSVVSTVNHKENVVYRMDGVTPADPTAINNAINNMQMKKQVGKKTEYNEVSKSMKAEKDRKDALANIDINNIAGVVVVDDLQAVTIEDPDFLLENEGFQEVTSKRTLKNKQKLEAEQKKTEKEALKKREHQNKVVARPKGLSPKTGRTSIKGSKLPPRLAKQKEQREKEKEKTKNVMPKIELWDNELANNIPSLMAGLDLTAAGLNNNTAVATSSSTTVDDTTDLQGTLIVNSKTSIANMIVPLSMTPAPAPPISAWSKPINFAASVGPVGSQSQQVALTSISVQHVSAVDVKGDRGDQHDSGIDVSDQPNSAASSTRSSPSADNKLITSTTIPHSSSVDPSTVPVLKKSDALPIDVLQSIELPKSQCPPKTSKSEKTVVKAEASVKMVKKIEMTSKEMTSTKPEPIQMPPSFKDSVFGKGDESNLQLDFHYDENLANPLVTIPEQPIVAEKNEPAIHKDKMNLSAPVTNSPTMVSPTSPATEDLSSKIASVKNFWDPPVFEHKTSLATSSSAVSSDNIQSNMSGSNTNANNVSGTSTSSSVFTNFSHDVGNNVVSVSVGGINESQLEETPKSGSSSVVSVPPAPRLSPVIQHLHPQETVMMTDVDMTQSGIMLTHDNKSMSIEPTNVCKVRPQQLQMGLGNDALSMSVLSSGLTGAIPTVASPPMMLTGHGYPTFQLGSQYVTQDRYHQASYGYSLSQAQPPASIGPQPQAPGQLAAQQTYNQASLFVPTTPTQQEYLSASQLGFTQRTHGFGQAAAGTAPPPPAQQSTIMVSSSTSALMSTNIKAPTASHAPAPSSVFSTDFQFAEPMCKAIGQNQISYGGGITGSSLSGTPSQQLYYYDPNPQLGQLFQPSQNLSNSLIGSQLVQTRTQVQPTSSFFQQAPTASFYPTQQPSSAIQVGAPIQQPSAAHQFSMQAFGNQPHGLGLAIQPASLDQGPAGPTALNIQTLGHSMAQPQSQQHQLTGSKGSIFGSMVSQQAHLSQPSQHITHTQPAQQHIVSRATQMKSPPHSSQLSNTYMSNVVPTYTQGQILSNKQFGSNATGLSHLNSHHTNVNINSHANNNMIMATGSQSLNSSAHGLSGKSSSSNSSAHTTMEIANNNGPRIGTQTLAMAGPPPPPPPPPQSTTSTGRSSTSSRYLNPNAPNFPPVKYGGASNSSSQTFVPAQQTPPSQPTNQPPSSGNNQVRPQMIMGNPIRSNAPQVPGNTRAFFPNPIQRPGGPGMPQGIQQFPPANANNSGPSKSGNSNQVNNAGGPNPLNLNAMNLGNNALLSSIISVAKSVINQQINMQAASNAGAPNPFAMKGPTSVPGSSYMGGSNRDASARNHANTGKAQGPQGMNQKPPNSNSSSVSTKAPGSYPDSLKAQQAKQRQEVLNHAANFLNSKAATNKESSKAVTSTTSTPPTTSKSEDKKPALAMVSNPSLVGTSVKINLPASSNTRAPALSSTTTSTESTQTVTTTVSTSSNAKNTASAVSNNSTGDAKSSN
nr:protein PRRC2C-like [Biomphalaria glabrata]